MGETMKNYHIHNVNSYDFDELDKKAQDTAVMHHVKFLQDSGFFENPEYFVNIAAKKMEEMQTPWFLGETLYHNYRKEIEEEIRLNKYDFFSDGNIFTIPAQFYAVER